MIRIINSVWIIVFLALCSCQNKEDDLSFKNNLQPVSDENILKTEGFHNWGASVIKGDNGKYHLFYSRWRDVHTAWLTYSEIAHAVSDNPSVPWERLDKPILESSHN